MPKEHKRRGRREEERKRKLEREGISSSSPKRQKTENSDDEVEILINTNATQQEWQQTNDGTLNPGEMPFYGLLDDQEQEYFKQADSLLELDEFPTPDERKLFLESIFQEARGKELKIACSQSCSRLMERMIAVSTPGQLKALFKSFSGQYSFLIVCTREEC